MNKNILNIIRLLDFDANSHAVYAGLDQHPLVFVSRNRYWVEEDFRRGLRLDLRDIMSFGGLGCEVREAEGGCQGGADAL